MTVTGRQFVLELLHLTCMKGGVVTQHQVHQWSLLPHAATLTDTDTNPSLTLCILSTGPKVVT